MAVWYERHGNWWMIQWCSGGWFSLGFHIEFRTRAVQTGQKFGPYVDLHIGLFIISVGRNPYYSSAWEGIISAGRGGEIVDGIR